MEFKLDNNPAKYLIQSVSAAGIKINDIIYQKNLIVGTDQLIENWVVNSFSELTIPNFEKIIALQPSILLLGTGAQHQFLKPELMSFLLNKRIGVEVMNTRAAARTFNVLISEGRNTVTALFI
jgi:uncharacterized protein